MKQLWHKLFIVNGITLLIVFPAMGQIISDDTTSTNINETNEGFEITGGSTAGGNIFHSFREFSISNGNEAFFNNADNVEHIISRVTGRNISNIDGLIRANGNANIFLINPAGIIFGENASLNIGGSFLGSTADSIVFPEGEFSATNTQSPPLLTINTPIGLNFGNSSGTITNRSQASPNSAVNGLNAPVGLQVLPGRTFALIGGKINFENGNLSVPGGHIELGSVGNNSLVEIIPNSSNWSFLLSYETVDNFQDIQLSQFSLIDTTDLSGLISISGSINVQGKRVSLTEASQIFAFNLSKEAGGKLSITASEIIQLSGDDSSIFTRPFGNGSAGNINIIADKLSLTDGGVVASLSSQTTAAASGELNVIVFDSIEIVGERTDGNGVSSLSIVAFTGNGGDLTVETENIKVSDKAQISTNTSGTGNGGNLVINASKIEVAGRPEGGLINSAIASQAQPGSTGNAGSLIIKTDNLTVRNGGVVTASTFGSGKGGNLSVDASDFISLNGISFTANIFRGSSGLFTLADVPSSGKGGDLKVTTPQLIIEKGAKVSAETFGIGNSGNVNLNVDRLILKDGGQVRASSLFAEETSNRSLGAGGTLTINANESIEIIGSGDINGEPVQSGLFVLGEGTGDAGSLEIDAGNVQLNDGEITAATRSTQGGNIDLNIAENLELRNDAEITATAGTGGDGGNVTINSDFILAFPTANNHEITARAFQGDGGNIQIGTNNILGRESIEISASSDFGVDGTIEIETPDVDPTSGVVELADVPVDAEAIFAQDLCRLEDGRIAKGSSFIITGRGGLTPTAEDSQSNIDNVVGWANREDLDVSDDGTVGVRQRSETETQTVNYSVIRQSQGWVKAEDGSVWLVASTPETVLQNTGLNHPDCSAN